MSSFRKNDLVLFHVYSFASHLIKGFIFDPNPMGRSGDDVGVVASILKSPYRSIRKDYEIKLIARKIT